MNDNLQPLRSAVLKKYERRGLRGDFRPPCRAAIRRWGRMIDPRLDADFDELYYDAHWQYVVSTWKRQYHWYQVPAEKMMQVKSAYSADTFPRLRDVVTHDGKLWFISGVMWMGDKHPPIARAQMVVSDKQEWPYPEPEDIYVGKIAHCKGASYRVTARCVMFYSMERLDELATQQQDLF